MDDPPAKDWEPSTFAYNETGEDVDNDDCVIDISDYVPFNADVQYLEVLWNERTDEDVDIDKQIALRKQELKNNADATVASDMRQSVNTRPDSVSFYPPL